jgi:DNA polymerase-3 subunit gamma/tau
LEDVARAPDRQASVEMVLIRLAYTADLPPPDEVIRRLGGESVPARRAPVPTDAPPPRPAPLNELPPEGRPRAQAETMAFEPAAAIDPASEDPAFAPFDPDAFVGDGEAASADDLFEGGDGEEDGRPAAAPGMAVVRTFGDVVALAGQKRDAKLKVHLEEHVSLVKFDPVAGSIDIHLLPGAPPEMANDLREKLNRWTGRRWVVMLSKVAGERAIAEVRREREAAELAELQRHPAVAAVLKEFPEARIAAVRPLAGAARDETGTG